MNEFNQEQEFIKDFPRLSKKQLMKKYQLTPAQYERIRKKNNLIKRERKLSADEIEYIKQNYKTMSDTEIGKVIGRPPNTIYQRRMKLNLIRNSRYVKSSDYNIDREYSICIWWLTGSSIEEIKLLYNNVRGVNVKKALSNKENMAKAIRGIKQRGCFPIVRTVEEIKNILLPKGA